MTNQLTFGVKLGAKLTPDSFPKMLVNLSLFSYEASEVSPGAWGFFYVSSPELVAAEHQCSCAPQLQGEAHTEEAAAASSL